MASLQTAYLSLGGLGGRVGESPYPNPTFCASPNPDLSHLCSTLDLPQSLPLNFDFPYLQS